ncbi:deoxynucleoside triphosphate triphosphohydrolase SAMHD1-like [Thunnus albacares]|uniref:deoxynucleoside triphosphate triphosphohydrolase SAMHD1-like n=1 Tax=Thunnus albacares TaxID=8236 RepID=UPI001CF696BA|nr:deoxynucleoside triphosphate triphosphohydrolase SAMHD1-like [Thunnus albacares]
MERPADYKLWGVEKTCQFLREEGLAEWEAKFREHKITGTRLENITADDLEKMGIERRGDRLRIWHIIKIKLWKIPDQSKVFNDSIHGHIKLHPLLVKIIDTPQFQRLRNIKQLGGGYFVFPGASHNRFEHSIGVACLAGQLVQNLKTEQEELNIDDRDILCVQIAGLCHDLGHGPFSHLFDGMFIPKVRPRLKWKHETASREMFDYLVDDNDLKPVMEQYGLKLPEDQTFITEMFAGPLDTNAAQGQTWPYKGRPEDKSFLYEIVANKRNGIDVDKFDYFARDCHHLGIQNNFDHQRFIMFARVCDVKGQKHICVRDKEVGNLYDMFYTRISLHRRAYQHRVNKIIEAMITEAFVKADEHFKIKGKDGKKFTLSTAIDDMEAYTKLTDSVFEKILNSSSSKLAEARKILEKIISRQLYKFLGQTKAKRLPEEGAAQNRRNDERFIDVTKEIISTWKRELAQALPDAQDGLKPEDFEIIKVTMNYGKKDQNPVNDVYFYRKNDHTRAFQIPQEQMSELRPTCFSETLIMVYCKRTDDNSLEAARNHFLQWCSNERFQVGDTVGL